MAEAWRRAADVATGALWIVAQAQTAGRGRRGRAWVSEPGNLYATLLLRDAGTTSRLGELSFIAALALHGAVEKATSASQGRSLGARLTLKWPNDLLLDGAKLAGVLIEAESRGASSAVAIGVGVNCAHSPEADYPVTSLAAQGLDVPPEAVMTALAGEMKRWLGLWDRGAGFEAVRAAWLERGDWASRSWYACRTRRSRACSNRSTSAGSFSCEGRAGQSRPSRPARYS